MNYLRDPEAIYARSFAVIRAEADLSHLHPAEHGIAIRIIHACGMSEVAADLRISPGARDAIRAALARGCTILTDCEMVRHGIIPRFLPETARIVCTLNDPEAKRLGLARRTTRSAAAVALWREELDGAIVVIGNAPTALFALLEKLDSGGRRPACIIGLPVGFVGAAESKAELVANPRGIPYVTLLGRRGGSAMAAAALNAVAAEGRA